jgi:cytosine permease
MEHRERFIAEGYVREAVPDAKLGSALEVFFISTGTMCGLPGYALSAQIAGALGFSRARTAFVCAGLICCVLAALTSYVGARTRMNLAIMSDHAFGTVGGRIIKTVIAVTLLGWVAVILSVLGTMFGGAISRMYKVEIPAAVIEAISAAAIATVTLRGVRGLESVGKLIAPTLAILLVWTLYHGCPGAYGELSQSIVPTMGIGAAISAVVGGFIVGILIQPDYARFVRHPTRAGIASGIALGVAFPLILTFTALPVARCSAPNLIAVMVTAGIGIPALVLLALGALIDGGASLYSGSLSLTNEVKRFRLPWVVTSAATGGLSLALLHAENYYLPFLSTLGVALPPVGALLVLHMLTRWRRQASSGSTVPLERIRLPAVVAWVGGTVVGYLGMRGVLTLTGIAALDSIGTAAAIWVIAWPFVKHER